MQLTHWDAVTHISVNKLSIIGSDNALSPGQRIAIIWTNAGILLIEPLGTNLSEILIRIHKSSLKKTHLKMLSVKCQSFYLRPQCIKTVIGVSAQIVVIAYHIKQWMWWHTHALITIILSRASEQKWVKRKFYFLPTCLQLSSKCHLHSLWWPALKQVTTWHQGSCDHPWNMWAELPTGEKLISWRYNPRCE